MSLAALRRYGDTLRYLRPVQVYGRLWFRIARPTPDLKPAPPPRAHDGRWQGCARPGRMSASDTFCFIGASHRLVAPADWNRTDWPKLWMYNAHYFDDLVASDAPSRIAWHRTLIARWIAENPPTRGVGWQPYPTSLRIVNWIKWAWAGNALDASTTHSLAVQARHLRKRLEYHLLGNHLWANAKALMFAGTFFQGAEADQWRRKGLALLDRELAEQVLADGGHFERSPMYQGIVLEDLLDLVQLGHQHPALFEARPARWADVASGMLRWLQVMTHPDSGIAFFNDAALGIAPGHAALADYARALGVPVDDAPLAAIEALPDSGYMRCQRGDAVLIADVAPIGPDYLPGHAHADTLSFELSVAGRRVLVNGGTSTYGPGRERLCQRGTAMHNTVVVDDVGSSEVWASFRVARRAYPHNVRFGQADGALWLEASHDGYQRLPGKVVHHRRWELGDGTLSVHDTLDGRFAHAEARFRFAPGVAVSASDGHAGRVTLPECVCDWRQEGAGDVRIESGTWHSHFGSSEPCQVLVLPFAEARLTFSLRWG